ncbi:putative sulfate exporter family transporter [Salinibacterium sp. ZJ454]|uniref:YeiH family protein n=1 Tax=Salinibacterium sp. ZJ454 TaxID=2708339 RepID=UPI001AB01F9E|nr:putative sulfate exporter family transporter [Salinibacterium sp. ZJ454]
MATTKRHAVTTILLVGVGLGTVLTAGIAPGLSALLLAIVIGAVVGNLRVLPPTALAGISWSSKKLLRAGIVLLGFKLSLLSLVDIGMEGIAVLLITVGTTFLGTLVIGRMLGVPRVTRLLVATGFSICGASAVAAMSSVVDPEGRSEEDTAQAVALVTIFGTIAMVGLPVLATLLQLSDLQSGVWIGASVHEVAQVVAAGGMVSAAALAVATVAKLGRVVLLAPLITLLGALESRRSAGTSTATRLPLVPLFILGFLAAVVVRTFVPLDPGLLTGLEASANVLLAAAMLGLGSGVDVRRLISTGWRPMILGALSTLLAATTALVAIAILGL